MREVQVVSGKERCICGVHRGKPLLARDKLGVSEHRQSAGTGRAPLLGDDV